MSTKHVYLKDLHGENQKWLNEIELYKEETLSYRNRLEEVASKNTAQEVMAKLESLQNQMIRHNEVFDTLEHEVKLQEKELAQFAADHPIAIDHKYFDDYTPLKERVMKERKIFTDFKEDVKEYLSKYM